MPAASVSPHQMTVLMTHLPHYAAYGTGGRAVAAERCFRRSLARLLKECGDNLLRVAETHARVLNGEQDEIIDLLVDHISSIFRRLDREGLVSIAGDPALTVPELEALDNRLLHLAEQALTLTRDLLGCQRIDTWFCSEAVQLSSSLSELSRAAEERNFLLGLGWESEFAGPGRRRR
jgi:hypothetical protein